MHNGAAAVWKVVGGLDKLDPATRFDQSFEGSNCLSLLVAGACQDKALVDKVKGAFPFCRPWLVDVLYLVGDVGWWISWEYVGIDVGANELVLDRAGRLGDVLDPGA